MPMKAWNVYLFGSWIDTVYFGLAYTANEVKEALIKHDEYDYRIQVKGSK